MKPTYLAAALIAFASLVVLNGCADPEPVAKKATTAKKAKAPESRESITPKSNMASESRNRTGESTAASNSTKTGRPNSVGRDQPDASGLGNKEAGGNPENEVASKKPSTKKKSPEPKKEFKLEFVESTGKEGTNPGDTIPNIKGSDIDEIKFQLSDYQGKVMMLDFWGDW